MTSVAEALAEARRRGVSSLDAQLLLARVLATTRTGLIADDDRVLSSAEERQWADWLEHRADDVPVAYLLGEKEFCGLMIEVRSGVLVPRPETELLVEWASGLIAMHDGAHEFAGETGCDIVDLGTGSGAIALAIRHGHPQARVTATDASPLALAVARANAQRLGLDLEFIECSWWDGLADRRFNLVVSNPPYVAAADPHLLRLRHEPQEALTPGGDGLAALRTIAADAAGHLREGGWLLLEHGFDQGESVRTLLRDAGLTGISTRTDLAGLDRATGGQWVAATS